MRKCIHHLNDMFNNVNMSFFACFFNVLIIPIFFSSNEKVESLKNINKEIIFASRKNY